MMSRNKVCLSIDFRTIANLIAATTLQDVRLELARNETLKLAFGHEPRHKVTMTGLFSMAFDIEEQQYVFT
jgi:hypothetical protein